MEKGEIVMIYHDPVTQEKPEGNAKLIKRIIENSDQEYWRVHFLFDPPSQLVDRWIEKED